MDHATPNLPSRNLDGTAEFYGRLGFAVAFKDESWMILRRGSIQLEFFPWPELDPYTTIASCCIRVADVDALHRDFASAGLPDRGIPRITKPELKPWRMYEFALVDADGNLLRCLAPG